MRLARREALRLGMVLALGLRARPGRSEAAVPAREFPVGIDAAQRVRLPNGLRVVLERDERQHRVAVVVRYGVGAVDDPPGYSGLAHVVEHMTYRGSRHLAPLEAFSRLERLGAMEVNGMTAWTETIYQCLVPADDLETALWIESERMAFTLEAFNEAHLALERRIVASELRQRGATEAGFGDMIRQAIYPEDHPNGRERASLSDVFAIELPHVQWFFQQWYRPDNACIALVGNFDPSTALGLVEQYFGPVRSPAWPLVRSARAVVGLPAVRMLRCEAPVSHEVLSFVWVWPRAKTESLRALDVASHVLTRRVRRSLTLTRVVAESVTSQVARLPEEILFMLKVVLLEEAEPKTAGKTVVEELRRVSVETLSAIELAEARGYVAMDLLLELEKLVGRAARYTSSEISPADELNEILSVDGAAVRRAARTYLSTEHRLVAILARNEWAPRNGTVVAQWDEPIAR